MGRITIPLLWVANWGTCAPHDKILLFLRYARSCGELLADVNWSDLAWNS